MRLLQSGQRGALSLTKDLIDSIPPYAILLHTWSVNDDDEMTFDDLPNKRGENKAGRAKLHFCREQGEERRRPRIFLGGHMLHIVMSVLVKSPTKRGCICRRKWRAHIPSL